MRFRDARETVAKLFVAAASLKEIGSLFRGAENTGPAVSNTTTKRRHDRRKARIRRKMAKASRRANRRKKAA